MKRRYLLSAVVAAVVAGAVAYFYGGSQVPAGQAPLDRLSSKNVADVRTAFNAAKDDVRVLLLLSPT